MTSRRLLLLDIGGVLVRLRPWDEAFAGVEIAPAPARDLERAVAEFKSSEPFLGFERGRVPVSEFLAALRRRFGLLLDDAALRAAYGRILGEPIPGMEELVAEAQGVGWRVAGLSDTSPLHLPILPRYAAVRRLERLVASCEIGHLKPSSAAFEAALELLAVQPHEVVFVDDREPNVEGARALGIEAIVFEGPQALRRALERSRAACPRRASAS